MIAIRAASLVTIVASVLTTAVSAGRVTSYYCSTTSADGQDSRVKLRVNYDNSADGCTGTTVFDAESAVIPSEMAFSKFCDDSGVFCGNVDIFPHAGMHIILDGHDVALGASDVDEDMDSAGVNSVCGSNFCLDKTGRCYAQADVWYNAPKTTCI